MYMSGEILTTDHDYLLHGGRAASAAASKWVNTAECIAYITFQAASPSGEVNLQTCQGNIVRSPSAHSRQGILYNSN